MNSGQTSGRARSARCAAGSIWVVCLGLAACVGEIPDRQTGSLPSGPPQLGPNGLPVAPGQVLPGQVPGQLPGSVPLPAAVATSCAVPDASELPLQRLSSLEYQLSLQDLFQLPAP